MLYKLPCYAYNKASLGKSEAAIQNERISINLTEYLPLLNFWDPYLKTCPYKDEKIKYFLSYQNLVQVKN